METLVVALGPAFATGFAIQRLLELLDPAFAALPEDRKKLVLGVVSVIVTAVLTVVVGLRVLRPLGVDAPVWADVVVTALVVSAGTEGFNSIMKFLGYAKQDKKLDAAAKQSTASPESLDAIARAV